MNKYGYSDAKSKEYVITRPDTPLPWINYLGSDDFFSLVSNCAGGYCFYKDARLRRLLRYRYNNIPLDSNGRYIYIRDGENVWNPMWKPMQSSLDFYECRHGLAYTKIHAAKNNLRAELLYFVPLGENQEVWRLKLINNSKKKKEIRLWSFIEWCLWDAHDDMTNFQRNLSIGEVEVRENTIFHKSEYRERRNHYAYFYCNKKMSGFESARDSFVGVHNDLRNPRIISDNEAQNSIANGWAPIGSHQIDIELEGGQSKDICFLLGYIENDKDKKFAADGNLNIEKFLTLKEKYKTTQSVKAEFAKLQTFWHENLSHFQCKTPDDKINQHANIWNQYQCMRTFNLSRTASYFESGIGRGMGFRDSNQDILGYVHMQQEPARQRILDIAATQLSDGTCFHQYQPLTKKGNADIGGGFMDDHLWLLLSCAAYIKESGDFAILDENIGYADQDIKQASLLDHLLLSIKFTLDNLGPKKLPLIGHADWNDCLNLNCFSTEPGESFQLAKHKTDDKIAESVMIAGLFCKACDELRDILANIDQNDKAAQIAKHAENMRANVEQHAWDGAWYIRAFDAEGNAVGTKANDEGQIFIESQGWCILGKIGLENGRAERALASVKERLAEKNGIKLQDPAYQKYRLKLGEISSYPPGYKENAGIFTHNNTWIQIAESMLGNGDQAMRYYKAVMPLCKDDKDEKIDTYRGEPYVYSQMCSSKDSPKPGEAKNSWLTGTAAWSFVTLSQHILGVKPDFNGLIIDPCIPKEWNEYEVTRKFRGSVYRIKVKNPNNISMGIKSIMMDGVELESNKLPIFNDNKTHEVEVIMG